MHISWLQGAGRTCTCQRGMCALWFNPGKGTCGPCSKGHGAGGFHRAVYPSQKEKLWSVHWCWGETGGALPPWGGSDRAGTSSLHLQSKPAQVSRRWWRGLGGRNSAPPTCSGAALFRQGPGAIGVPQEAQPPPTPAPCTMSSNLIFRKDEQSHRTALSLQLQRRTRGGSSC